jgi:glutamate racemase
MKLGTFDSGIGGEALAAALTRAFPTAIITTVNDRAHLPYGNRTPDEIIALTDAAIQPLLANSDVIVIACNTATSVAITTLRKRYPQQRFIGIEPMIKTAAQLSQNHTIAVCATPVTLASERYCNLIHTHGTHLTIIEPDCSNWAYMIESNQINRHAIVSVIQEVCSAGADVIVLGCTHYHWIKDIIKATAQNNAVVIEPSDAIARRVKSLLE